MRFAFVLLLAACGGSAPKAQATAPIANGDPTCPMEVPGTSVTVEDTDKGAAFVFATTGDANELHKRGGAFAAHLQDPKGDGHAFADMIKTPSTAVASRVPPNIERLELAPKAAGDMAALQSELRMHASMLTAGSCKMSM